MINYVKYRRKRRILNKGIGHKDADQPDIFKRQSAAFAKACNQTANFGRQHHIKCLVDQKEQSDGSYRIAELLHHHETGKYHEDLASCATHKGEGVIEPIARPQDEGFSLHSRRLECGKERPGGQGDEDGYGSTGQIDPLVVKPNPLPDDEYQSVSEQTCETADSE